MVKRFGDVERRLRGRPSTKAAEERQFRRYPYYKRERRFT